MWHLVAAPRGIIPNLYENYFHITSIDSNVKCLMRPTISIDPCQFQNHLKWANSLIHTRQDKVVAEITKQGTSGRRPKPT